MEYEAAVDTTFRSLRIVALCSYCLDTCSPGDVIDVMRHHPIAVARRAGENWELLQTTVRPIGA